MKKLTVVLFTILALSSLAFTPAEYEHGLAFRDKIISELRTQRPIRQTIPFCELQCFLASVEITTKGDCDDYALIMQQKAREAGIDMQVNILDCQQHGVYDHVVNLVFTDRGWVLLEPQSKTIMRIMVVD